VIANDFTFSFASRRYQIPREQAQAGMRRQRLRVELRLNGELKAHFQGRYLDIAECGAARATTEPVAVRKPPRKDHNAGGKSVWMQGFFERPTPALWKLIGRTNKTTIRKARFYRPKPRLGKFHHKQVSSRKALLGDRLRPPGF